MSVMLGPSRAWSEVMAYEPEVPRLDRLIHDMGGRSNVRSTLREAEMARWADEAEREIQTLRVALRLCESFSKALPEGAWNEAVLTPLAKAFGDETTVRFVNLVRTNEIIAQFRFEFTGADPSRLYMMTVAFELNPRVYGRLLTLATVETPDGERVAHLDATLTRTPWSAWRGNTEDIESARNAARRILPAVQTCFNLRMDMERISGFRL